MSVRALQTAIHRATRDGRLTADEVDRLALTARSGRGLDEAERAELQRAVDAFGDDPAKQRLLRHLSALAQTSAWVNIDARGPAIINGRYAEFQVGVPGLSAKLGLFDNCFSLKGTAEADGRVQLTIEGRKVSVQVQRGDTAAQILEKVRQALPSHVAGVTLSGEVQPYDMASYRGAQAGTHETAAHLMLYKPASLGLAPGELPVKVVVTGYGAFMGITDNPSAALAQQLSELGVRGGVVEYRRLDVTTDAVDAFIAEVRARPPDVILSMGVSSHAQVEERPQNFLAANRDGNNDFMTAREVIAGGERELTTDLPVAVIDEALYGFGSARAVGTSLSDAGYAPDRSAYLCNYLGYQLASSFGASDETTAGFVHITGTTPVEQMHAVLQAVTARQLDVRRASS